MSSWRTIGILGGMGPAATADFLQRLVTAIAAPRDEDHPRILIDSSPNVPDRNAARAGNGPSPGPALAAMARGLVASGAEILAMPCNAAHGWAADITAAPFISMIEAAAAQARAHAPTKIGLIAIGATLDARLYHNALSGIDILECDRTIVQPAVTAIKSGDKSPQIHAALTAEATRLTTAGAQVIIAACTEVPLVLTQSDVSVPLVDATAALVTAVIAAARKSGFPAG